MKTAQMPPMSEADLADWVISVAHLYGWKVAGFRPARTAKGWRTPVQADGAGWPDLALVHPTRGLGIALELKSDEGRTTPDQEAWLAAIGRTGWVARVARPRDREAIRALLAGKSA